jgi:hypothetical protein
MSKQRTLSLIRIRIESNWLWFLGPQVPQCDLLIAAILAFLPPPSQFPQQKSKRDKDKDKNGAADCDSDNDGDG